jgi:L-ascorbate metabolism protein UlaG (beta-lactamase superfamily)
MTPARSDHFNGKTFHQPHHATSGRFADLLRWKLRNRATPWPASIPFRKPPPPPRPSGDQVVATWLGHASFLLQTATDNLLVDPVFSERVSPVTWAGPRRVHPPGLAFEALPRIDTVLVSHDHYDHCDLASLRRLATEHAPRFVAPLRHADLFAQADIAPERLTELDWWQTFTLPSGLELTLTPSKHWSNRFGSPRNHRLWGGFSLRRGAKRIWFVGDTGYDAEIFRAVRTRCGAPDLALVPIGAYEPRWFMAPMHLNPAEAVQLHRDVDARLSIGMHWGTFQLTDEGRDDPVNALEAARRAAGIGPEQFRVLAPGESVIA